MELGSNVKDRMIKYGRSRLDGMTYTDLHFCDVKIIAFVKLRRGIRASTTGHRKRIVRWCPCGPKVRPNDNPEMDGGLEYARLAPFQV
jgi:hypothetical protein